jgi:2-oxoglutarate ferredoxin oxidoreductase subunit beta
MDAEKLYERPKCINPLPSGYCPGCLHSTASKIIAEIVDEMGLQSKSILVLPVGCSTLGLLYWKLDMVGSAHGRAPAVATGVKRCSPDNLVFTYQGDGDLCAIGLAEIMSAANRGEDYTVIFANNSIYGMTGGQMAPTTLEGQWSTTSQSGRDVVSTGYPMRMCELLSVFEAPKYIARFALNKPANSRKAKKGIKKAFDIQMSEGGFTFVELLVNCPTSWKMSPPETLDYIGSTTSKEFPLGVFRDATAIPAEVRPAAVAGAGTEGAGAEADARRRLGEQIGLKGRGAAKRAHSTCVSEPGRAPECQDAAQSVAEEAA